MKQAPILTIAIPTFNREAELRRCLAALAPLLDNPLVRLIILDNASRICASEIALSELDPERADFRVIRHSVNFGAHANFLKCFEYASDGWVWLLGDDDVVVSDAVATVLNAIAAHPKAGLLVFEVKEFSKFLGVAPATTEQVFSTVGEYLSSDAFFHASLISSAVYKVSSIKPHIKAGYEFASSCFPHVAIAISTLLTESQAIVKLPTSLVLFLNDGDQEHPKADVLANIRYLSRMLPRTEDRALFMSNSFMRHFVHSSASKASGPTFKRLVVASAFKRTEAGRDVLRRGRVVAADCIQYHSPNALLPWEGLWNAVMMAIAVLSGRVFAPVVRAAYFFWRRRVQGHPPEEYPKVLDSARQKLLP